jgi:hypothetical protein
MNEFKILKVSDLRAKLATIPARLLLSLLILLGILTHELNEASEMATLVQDGTWVHRMEAMIIKDPMHVLYLLLVIYGLVSYLYFFMRMFHSWIIGLIAGAGVAFLIYEVLSAYAPEYLPYLLWIYVFAGVLVDVLRLMRYVHLRQQVINAHDDDVEDAYGDGYDRGFDRGYRRAVRENRRMDHERRKELEYDEYDEEEDDDEDYDEGYEEDTRREEKIPAGNRKQIPEISFFRDCRDEASIRRRYRELCKVYHPDSGNGSTEIFEAVNREYNELMAGF